MTKTRVPISDELAAEVMFKANRTCCVCREPRKAVQIHHVDEDPSNNTPDNLAVLCSDCHSDAHTTQAFARNLTPHLIRLYNRSWRDVVAARLRPNQLDSDAIEYQAEVILELQLVTLRWMSKYLRLVPSDWFPDSDDFSWQTLMDGNLPEYSKESIDIFYDLFDSVNEEIASRIEEIVSCYSDAIPVKLKLQAFRSAKNLRLQRIAYRRINPTWEASVLPVDFNEYYFSRRFVDSIMALQHLSDLAEQERLHIFPTEPRSGSFSLV